MINKIIVAVFLLMHINVAFSDEVDMDKINQLAVKLKDLSQNPELIATVKKQNQASISLDEIKKRDEKWIDTSGLDDFMSSLMTCKAAKILSSIEKKNRFIVESFLMDNQGANVAMTNKTSDYWQGDEAKFKQSFNNGVGATHVGKAKFDTSAQAYLVQISIPVMDAGKAIGAVTYGVNLDDL